MGHEGRTYGKQQPSLRGALIATFAFILVFAASAAPIPLYSQLQETVGIADAEVSLTAVFYLFGVLVVLFVGGSASDALGRRPLVVASLVLCAIGCVLFTRIDSGLTLQAVRLFQGLAGGFAMSATSAFVIDSCGRRYRTLGVTVASCGSLVGITAGSLAVGLFSTVSERFELVFLTLAALCVVTLVLLPLAHETVHDRITLRRAVGPIAHIPARLRPMFPIVAGMYIATWGVGMFFQSLSTPASVEYFGATGPLMPAVLLAVAMAPSAVGGPIEARMTSRAALRVGLVAFFASCVGLTATLQVGAFWAFLAFDLVFSVSQGVCLSVGMRMLVEASEPSENAAVVSLINFAGYVGSTVLSLSMSGLATFVPLAGVLGFVSVMGLGAVFPGLFHSFVEARRERAARTQGSRRASE